MLFHCGKGLIHFLALFFFLIIENFDSANIHNKYFIPINQTKN